MQKRIKIDPAINKNKYARKKTKKTKQQGDKQKENLGEKSIDRKINGGLKKERKDISFKLYILLAAIIVLGALFCGRISLARFRRESIRRSGERN